MSEYIIEWSGIGARIVELIGSETPCLVVKRLRKERLREPIVRCRDCKFAYEDEIGALRCHGYLVDSWDYYNDEPSIGKQVEPNEFCAWGERRQP